MDKELQIISKRTKKCTHTSHETDSHLMLMRRKIVDYLYLIQHFPPRPLPHHNNNKTSSIETRPQKNMLKILPKTPGIA